MKAANALLRPAAVVLLAYSISVNAQEPFDFKGTKLGSHLRDLPNRLRYDCRPNITPIADAVCTLESSQQETIAGATVRSMFLYYYDNQLSSISLTIEARSMDEVVAALTGRYGQPRVDQQTVANRKDGRTTNQINTWSNDVSMIEVRSIGAGDNASSVRFYSADAPTQFRIRSEKIKARNAKDL